jgi:hypothetical protein
MSNEGRRWPIITTATVLLNLLIFLGTHGQMECRAPWRDSPDCGDQHYSDIDLRSGESNQFLARNSNPRMKAGWLRFKAAAYWLLSLWLLEQHANAAIEAKVSC